MTTTTLDSTLQKLLINKGINIESQYFPKPCKNCKQACHTCKLKFFKKI